MTGYVFHCTPCGKPHAGECPPKYIRIVEPVKVDFVTHYAGAVKPQYFIPHLGTKWNIEDFNFNSGAWTQRVGYDLHYTVLSVDLNRQIAMVSTHSTGLNPWNQEIDLDAFLATGHDGFGARFRMVHRP
jgi:hypothetical protein